MQGFLVKVGTKYMRYTLLSRGVFGSWLCGSCCD